MFEANHKYTGVGAGLTVEVYPTSKGRGGRRIRDAWYMIVRDGADATYYGRRLSTDGVIRAAQEYGIALDLLAWDAVPHAEMQIPPWHKPIGETLDTIYFISAIGSGRIKIGWTNHLYRRVEELITDCPYPVELIHHMSGTCKDERSIHRHLAHLRLHNEWFQDCPELREYIATL